MLLASISGGVVEALIAALNSCANAAMPVLHAFGRCFKITVEVDGKAKEEFVKDGQTWIGVEPGEAFQVKVDAEAAPASKDPTLSPAPAGVGREEDWLVCFHGGSLTFTYSGYDMLGDGSQIHTSSASPARRRAATALLGDLTAELVRELTTHWRRNQPEW